MKARELADSVCKRLRGAGYQAYLVGGCVRDILLGREPADYDVATDATPEQVEQRCLKDTLRSGREVWGDDRAGRTEREAESAQVEVATFRSDNAYSDGRHPDQVRYSKTPQEDVEPARFHDQRAAARSGDRRVLDFVGGRADLNAGIIRAIGDPGDSRRTSCGCCARCGSRHDLDTRSSRPPWRPYQKLAPRFIRCPLSGFAGADQILTEGAARRGFELLDETGLLSGGAARNFGDEGRGAAAAIPSRGRCVDSYADAAGRAGGGRSATLAWGALLHDVGKPPTFRRRTAECVFAFDRSRGSRGADGGGDLPIGCAFRTRIRSKSWRWWRTTCDLRMCRR